MKKIPSLISLQKVKAFSKNAKSYIINTAIQFNQTLGAEFLNQAFWLKNLLEGLSLNKIVIDKNVLNKRNNNYSSYNIWKNFKQSNLSSGFSLLELVTVVAIIGVLLAVAVPFYSKYQRRAIQGRMKHEVANLSKSLAYAHSVDGGYHQRIYTAGYKPDQELITETGFQYARNANPCCNLFPNFASSSNFSKFFTITNTTSGIESSIRATHICNGGKCKINADCVPAGVNNIRLSSIPSGAGSGACGSGFTSGSPGFGSCNCENYIIYAVSDWRGKMYLYANQKGLFCAKIGGAPGEEI